MDVIPSEHNPLGNLPLRQKSFQDIIHSHIEFVVDQEPVDTSDRSVADVSAITDPHYF